MDARQDAAVTQDLLGAAGAQVYAVGTEWGRAWAAAPSSQADLPRLLKQWGIPNRPDGWRVLLSYVSVRSFMAGHARHRFVTDRSFHFALATAFVSGATQMWTSRASKRDLLRQ